MNLLTKKISITIISTSFLCLLILYMDKYLKIYLNDHEILSDIIIRSVLIIILLFIVRFLGLTSFVGLRKNGKFIYNNRLVLALAILAFLFVILNSSRLVGIEKSLLSLFLYSCLLVGFFEEIWIRGIILPLLIKGNQDSERRFFVGVLFSSFIFSILHYLNLFNDANNFADITSQVLFAFGVGIVFGALTLRIGNILPTSIFHGVFNFSFGLNRILDIGNTETVSDQSSKIENLEVFEIIINISILLLIIMIGLKLLSRLDKERISADLSKIRL